MCAQFSYGGGVGGSVGKGRVVVVVGCCVVVEVIVVDVATVVVELTEVSSPPSS